MITQEDCIRLAEIAGYMMGIADDPSTGPGNKRMALDACGFLFNLAAKHMPAEEDDDGRLPKERCH